MKKYQYDIEIIHEPSGEYLNYSFESELAEDEIDIYKEFIRDISVVVSNVEEIEEEEE